jgi:hypothetical protein
MSCLFWNAKVNEDEMNRMIEEGPAHLGLEKYYGKLEEK